MSYLTLNNPVSRMQLAVGMTAGSFRGSVNHQPAEGNPVVGSATGQVQKMYNADVTVPGSGTNVLTIDLSTVLDPAGNAFNPAKVTHMLIENLSTTPGEDMTVGGGSNPVIAALPFAIRAAGGRIMVEDPGAGITVDGTHKNLQLVMAAGTNVAGRITIWGR